MGAYCFEILKEEGINTHYRGLVTSDGKIVTTSELEESVNIMEMNLVRVFKPKFKAGSYDYSIFQMLAKNGEGNFLLPLEIIYRNGLPEGSSIFKRLEKGEVSLEDLGLEHHPKPGEKLKKPIFDASTKLEEKDRYITWLEAKRISGLTDEEIDEVKNRLIRVNNIITRLAKRIGLENEDGKIELAFNSERRLMVVDVVGTLDECRFTFEGFHVSKEIARQFYKETLWYREIEKAKREASMKGIKEWKNLCKSQPPKLDEELRKIISNMYMATANEWTELNLFDAPKLKDVIKEYREYLREKRKAQLQIKHLIGEVYI
jgi:phosphoribosylaminoimidazole-succinocarboxamide synthase